MPRNSTRPVEVTKRQWAIIDLIAAGRTDKEIAAGLGISYRTVRTHLERLYGLNDVHCRAALVALFVKRAVGVASGGELLWPDADLHESPAPRWSTTEDRQLLRKAQDKKCT